MFSKLPRLCGRFYNNTNDYQDLYTEYKSVFKDMNDIVYQEQLMHRCIDTIYNDYINDGFGHDWSRELSYLIGLMENTKDLNYLVEDLKKLGKYSRGYNIQDKDILVAGDILETIYVNILQYIDKVKPWNLIKSHVEL